MKIKSKITIITPVHIGTGEEKMSFEYNKEDNVLYCYDPKELFLCKSSKELLDKRFLNSLLKSNDGSKRDELNRMMKKDVDYNKLKSIYSLRAEFTKIPKGNVSEQLKSLNKPYIPGSSIKGAIMNAIFYDFIKNHLDDFCKYIKNKVATTKNKPDIDDFLKYCDSRLLDLVKQISNCIICRDIFYENLVLVEPIRKNVYDNKKDKLSLSNFECIDANQTCDDELIKINSVRKNVIIGALEEENLKNGNIKFCNEFMEYLSINKIIKVCRAYFHDILGEEIKMEKNNNYYIQEGLDKKLNEFYKNPVPNGFYMRIGGNTNYFFKTVSYLIKNNDNGFYTRYFYKVFSPKDKPKDEPKGKNKAYPLPDKMPATRTIYLDDLYAYYPGVIKVEFYKEN